MGTPEITVCIQLVMQLGNSIPILVDKDIHPSSLHRFAGEKKKRVCCSEVPSINRIQGFREIKQPFLMFEKT